MNLKLTKGRLKEVEPRLKEAEEKNRMRMKKFVLLILLEAVVNETGKLIFVNVLKQLREKFPKLEGYSRREI